MTPTPICTSAINAYMMHGRVVFINECIGEQLYRPKGKKLVCHDCNADANFNVYELDGTHWHWCGECDPGG